MDWDRLRDILVTGLALAAILFVGCLMIPPAHGQWQPGGSLCPPGGCQVGARGPFGAGAQCIVGGGRGVQARVQGPYGGRVSAGVTPPTYTIPRPVAGKPWPGGMVRLESPRGRWSGVLICAGGPQKRGIIATSSHSFPDAEAGQTTAVFSDGSRFRCSLAGRDDQADCVLLWIQTGSRPCMVMAETNPPTGERIRVYGFGGDGRPCPAIVTGKAAPGGTDRWEWFSFSPENAAQPGDSGGPIIDSKGNLVGIVSGTGTGVGVSVMKALLAKVTSNGTVPGPQAPTEVIDVPDDAPPILPLPPDTGRLDELAGRLDRLEARPVVPIAEWEKRHASLQARDEATLHSLQQHSEMIRLNSQGITILNQWRDSLEARVAALEAERKEPLFYQESWVQQLDGTMKQIQPRTPVLRGGTLKYTGVLTKGAATESFDVNVDEGGE